MTNKTSEESIEHEEMTEEEAMQKRIEMAKRIMEEHKSLFERLSRE